MKRDHRAFAGLAKRVSKCQKDEKKRRRMLRRREQLQRVLEKRMAGYVLDMYFEDRVTLEGDAWERSADWERRPGGGSVENRVTYHVLCSYFGRYEQLRRAVCAKPKKIPAEWKLRREELEDQVTYYVLASYYHNFCRLNRWRRVVKRTFFPALLILAGAMLADFDRSILPDLSEPEIFWLRGIAIASAIVVPTLIDWLLELRYRTSFPPRGWRREKTRVIPAAGD